MTGTQHTVNTVTGEDDSGLDPREDWPGLGVGIAIPLIAAGSAFAGPRGMWLSDGVGCCVAGLGYGAAQAGARDR